MRYNSMGNVISSRQSFIPVKKGSTVVFLDAIETLSKTIPNTVYSAMFRFHYDNSDSDQLFTDYYPTSIDRSSIRPGTIIYDPNGHVAIVYKVMSDGRIYFIDAHPDNSLTAGLYGSKFVRSSPYQGSGFKNFRPTILEGSTFDTASQSYVGGRILPFKNKNLENFDTVQFFGTNRLPLADWKKGIFEIGGQKMDYYQYVRNQLSIGLLKLNPSSEIKNLAEDLCQTVIDRVDAVNAALKIGIQNKPQPTKLPDNIYGTSGEWEDYSTPSRDARLKTSFVELRNLAADLLQKHQQNDPQIDYSGSDLKLDLKNTYLAASAACKISYTKTNNS